MALVTYKTYRFMDKDPMIDKLRTVVQDAYPGRKGLDKSKIAYSKISAESGVSEHCLRNWFEGDTRRPQFATMCAVARAADYDLVLVKKNGKGK